MHENKSKQSSKPIRVLHTYGFVLICFRAFLSYLLLIYGQTCHFLTVALSMFVSTSASDCLQRLVSEMTCYVSSRT